MPEIQSVGNVFDGELTSIPFRSWIAPGGEVYAVDDHKESAVVIALTHGWIRVTGSPTHMALLTSMYGTERGREVAETAQIVASGRGASVELWSGGLDESELVSKEPA